MTLSWWQKRKGIEKIGGSAIPLEPIAADIAVVGGGLVGISTAHFLKSLGCQRVIVLEKNFVGYGASGRNAGFILSGLSEPYVRLLTGMGKDSARRLMKATFENHDLIAGAIREKNIECAYQRSGSYHLAVSEVERRELEESAELMIRDGFRAEYVDRLPGPAGDRFSGYMGGYYCPHDGKIDPFAFVRGLAAEIEVFEDFGVEKIVRKNGMVELSGGPVTVRAELVVLAVNGYAPLLDNFFGRFVFPVRGQMLATSPLNSNVLGQNTYYANFGYDYFRQADDNAVIMGGLRNRFFKDEVGYDDKTNPALQAELEEYIRNNLGIDHFDVAARWSGVMGNTIDGLPLIGALPHNSSVLAAVGFNGHGFGLGMLAARDLATAIMKNENSEILGRFSLKRFA